MKNGQKCFIEATKMCLMSSNQHDTQNQPFQLQNVEKMIWRQNVTKSKRLKGSKLSTTYYLDGIVKSKIWKSLVELSKCFLFNRYGLRKDLDQLKSKDDACDNEKENISTIHPDTSTVANEENEIENLHEELLQTKNEIQHNISLYQSYIKELSSYILYTNIMIMLLHFMILAILISYPSCLYLYLYIPLQYL